MILKKREKIAWRFSLIFASLMLLNILGMLFLRNFKDFFLYLALELFLVGIVYMAFKKGKFIFSFLGGSCKNPFGVKFALLSPKSEST